MWWGGCWGGWRGRGIIVSVGTVLYCMMWDSRVGEGGGGGMWVYHYLLEYTFSFTPSSSQLLIHRLHRKGACSQPAT